MIIMRWEFPTPALAIALQGCRYLLPYRPYTCVMWPLRNLPYVSATQYKLIHDPPCWFTGFTEIFEENYVMKKAYSGKLSRVKRFGRTLQFRGNASSYMGDTNHAPKNSWGKLNFSEVQKPRNSWYFSPSKVFRYSLVIIIYSLVSCQRRPSPKAMWNWLVCCLCSCQQSEQTLLSEQKA